MSALSELIRYAVPGVVLLLEVIAFGFIICRLRYIKKAKQELEINRAGAEALGKAAAESGRAAYLLIRREDMLPIAASSNFEAFTGLSFDRLKEDIELLSEIAPEEYKRNFKRLYNGEEEQLNFTFQMKGSDRWLRLEVSGSDTDILLAFSEATEEINTVRELREQLLEANRASESKTAFLSNMSHEIRTPMNGIIGMLSLIRLNMQPDEKVEQYLEKTESLSQYMITLINDILDMSRIEAGKIELAEDKFSIYALAEKVNSLFRKTIEEKGVKFTMELCDLEIDSVVGDELRIMQVLANFMSNAIKFTSKGEITFTIRQMRYKDGIANLMFRVRDTGKGIEPQFLKHIFQPFEQESAKVTKKYGGSGLGMAIADQMVTLMGGEIVVDSMLDKGSDFSVYLSLPAEPDKGQRSKAKAATVIRKEAPVPKEISFNGIRILLAEDNEINAEIAQAMLEMRGAEVELAVNGQEAVDKFADRTKGYYDIILMDVQMPVLDGREATRIIRNMRGKGGDEIPIFALSAEAFVEDKRESVAAGMNGHISKPINFDELNMQLMEALSVRR